MRQGGREEAVEWRPALSAMKLSPEQLAAVLDARSTVTGKVEECAPIAPTFVLKCTQDMCRLRKGVRGPLKWPTDSMVNEPLAREQRGREEEEKG